MGYKIKRTANRLFPPGVYEAQLQDVKVESSKFDEDKKSITLKFKTSYSEYGEAGWKLFKSCTFSLHPDSVFLPIAETLLGRKISEDEEIDTDKLLNQRCLVKVVNKVGKQSNKMGSRVEAIMPLNGPPELEVYEETESSDQIS